MRLAAAHVAISMDGRGRVFDNIFVERLWRTVEYADLYLQNYGSVVEMEGGLAGYFWFYNHQRIHQALDYRTPAEMHCNYEQVVPPSQQDQKGKRLTYSDRILALTMGSSIDKGHDRKHFV
jgi:hypothetical protein